MAYTLHYTSADRPGDDAPWSVYREVYADAAAEEPIEGLTVRVSTHPTEAEACAQANQLQATTTIMAKTARTIDVASTSMASIHKVIKALEGVTIADEYPTPGACGYTRITITQEKKS